MSSDEKAKLAGAADLVVNYREPGAAERIGTVDRIVEVALGPNLELDLAVAKPHTVISRTRPTSRPPRCRSGG